MADPAHCLQIAWVEKQRLVSFVRQRVLEGQDIDLFITVNDIPTLEDYRLCWIDYGFIRRKEHWHLTSKISCLRVVSAMI